MSAWCVYVAGVLLLSGGMFLHMTAGEPGEGSWGTTTATAGAVVLAGAVLYLAWRLYRARHVEFGSGISGHPGERSRS